MFDDGDEYSECYGENGDEDEDEDVVDDGEELEITSYPHVEGIDSGVNTKQRPEFSKNGFLELVHKDSASSIPTLSSVPRTGYSFGNMSSSHQSTSVATNLVRTPIAPASSGTGGNNIFKDMSGYKENIPFSIKERGDCTPNSNSSPYHARRGDPSIESKIGEEHSNQKATYSTVSHGGKFFGSNSFIADGKATLLNSLGNNLPENRSSERNQFGSGTTANSSFDRFGNKEASKVSRNTQNRERTSAERSYSKNSAGSGTVRDAEENLSCRDVIDEEKWIGNEPQMKKVGLHGRRKDIVKLHDHRAFLQRDGVRLDRGCTVSYRNNNILCLLSPSILLTVVGGRSFRLLSLTPFSNGYVELLPNQPVEFDVEVITPNSQGDCVAISGIWGCAVMLIDHRKIVSLVSKLCAGGVNDASVYQLEVATVSVGSKYLSNCLENILRVYWHPLSDRHLAFLTSNGVLSLYHFDFDTQNPEQVFPIKLFGSERGKKEESRE